MSTLGDDTPTTPTCQISSKRIQIIGMRNRLAHDYLGTRLDIVFATARDFAPLLITQLEPIIAELETDPQR
jgi:uncharacterized protein with HEPN domain